MSQIYLKVVRTDFFNSLGTYLTKEAFLTKPNQTSNINIITTYPSLPVLAW